MVYVSYKNIAHNTQIQVLQLFTRYISYVLVHTRTGKQQKRIRLFCTFKTNRMQKRKNQNN